MSIVFNPLDILLLIQILGVAFGITYVITGSTIGYRVRLSWTLLTYWQPLRRLWPIALCPSCNAWWTGAALAFLIDLPIINVLQMAFTSCGVVAYIQFRLGGAGIAADEDWEKILGELFHGKETE